MCLTLNSAEECAGSMFHVVVEVVVGEVAVVFMSGSPFVAIDAFKR
jgi:hypothetical protein